MDMKWPSTDQNKMSIFLMRLDAKILSKNTIFDMQIWIFMLQKLVILICHEISHRNKKRSSKTVEKWPRKRGSKKLLTELLVHPVVYL